MARLIFLEAMNNIRIGALIRMGAFIGIGALINKNTFEGGHLFEWGVLIARRALNQIITVFGSLKLSQNFFKTSHFNFSEKNLSLC